MLAYPGELLVDIANHLNMTQTEVWYHAKSIGVSKRKKSRTWDDKKTCSRCESRKPRSEFYVRRASPDGLSAFCKQCANPLPFSMTATEFEKRLVQQNHVCDICKKPCSSGKRLSIDHNHCTGKIRGLLCNKCNLGLGMFLDSFELLEAASRYLKYHLSKA